MLLLYCSDPLAPRQPDDVYRPEVDVATRLDLFWHLLDHDALVRDHDPNRAARRVPVQSRPTTAVYRGWMMRAEQ